MVTSMSKPKLDPNMLAQFTGSERFYRHAMFRNVIYTEGAKYVADRVGAYWLEHFPITSHRILRRRDSFGIRLG